MTPNGVQVYQEGDNLPHSKEISAKPPIALVRAEGEPVAAKPAPRKAGALEVKRNPRKFAALALARKSFKVFPCRQYLEPDSPEGKEAAAKAAKAPAIDNWQNLATTNEAQITAWWDANPNYNIGISTEDLLVIDVDIGKGGVESYESFKTTHAMFDEVLPETAASTTWSGGRHEFYRLPYGVVVRNTVGKLGLGIDTRGFGGLVVGPGSEIEGKKYAWANTASRKMAPQWLIDCATQSKPKTQDPR